MKYSRFSRPIRICCVSMFVIWILFMCVYLSNYNYLYPTIIDPKLFVQWTLINLALPSFPLISALILFTKNKKYLGIICLISFIPFLIFAYIRGTTEVLFSPTVCSHTDDSANFGKYDDRLRETLDLNPILHFPEEIPDNVYNVKYCYYYKYASSETMYISVSWQYENETDYAGIISDFDQIGLSDGKDYYCFSDSYYNNIVYIDDANYGIAFVMSTESNVPLSRFNDLFHS